ncbi:MAG TPA: tetratricopeptide repeat protein, partial [Gemmatimonadaceae bacterium]
LTEKNYKAASDELESVVKLDTSYMPAYFQIGHVAALSGANLTRGEEALRKYLPYRPKEDEPSIARAYFWLGGIYEKQGRKADAKASYAASLQINPNQKDAGDALKRVS